MTKNIELYHSLNDLLARQQYARYRGLVISVTDYPTLYLLSRTLSELLPEDLLWQEPGQNQAPSLSGNWTTFIDQVLQPSAPNLILQRPEIWLADWSPLEQKNFWSRLAATFGRRRVLVLVVENLKTREQLNCFFSSAGNIGAGLHWWRSRRELPISQERS